MTRYRKKPVEIEAMQWEGFDYQTQAIIEWITQCGGEANYRDGGTPSLRQIDIVTLEGTMAALPGDWIIRGVKGEFYPCKPDIFDATYDSVDGDAA